MFKIVISKEIYEISKTICRRIREEWYAFALGRFQNLNGNDIAFYITDLYIPQQEASITHVRIPSSSMVEMFDAFSVIEKERENWTLLGMWHSHGEVRVFHSFVDLENINKIFKTFPTQHLPMGSISEKIFGPEILGDIGIEPIISGGFRGIRMCFGSTCLEIDFRQQIDDEKFFANWYSHFYVMRAFVEIIKEYFGSIPIIKGTLKKIVRYIVSVVVNNHNEIEGKIFAFDPYKRSESPSSFDASISIENLRDKPLFARKESLNEILSKIRMV